VGIERSADEFERAREIVDRLHADGVSAVALTFVDNSGITRVKTVPVGRLANAVSSGVGMSPVFDFFLVDDSIAPEASPTGDLRLIPDLTRLVVLSPASKWAWAPVDRYEQNGEPYPGCQRGFARRMIAAARDRGLEAQMGFEIEWAVGSEDGEGRFIPACRGPAYGMARVVELADYVADLHDALASQTIEVLQIHPEYAPGQFECSAAPTDPLAAADQAVLMRETIRTLTERHGMRASFAPVVVAGGVGNGAHLHLSVWRDGQNLFAQGDGPYGLTAEGESFLAALLDQLPALVAVGAPSVASYLRLVPSRWAGAYRCWGHENREAAVRIITGSSGEPAPAANAEVKCLDSAANPYLVVGGVLALGLAGLGSGLKLPGELTGDPASLSDEARARLGVARLPARLDDALEHLARCDPLVTAMGPSLFEAFMAVRRAELTLFSGASDQDVVAATRWRY
jgi:glutamine synthetase